MKFTHHLLLAPMAVMLAACSGEETQTALPGDGAPAGAAALNASLDDAAAKSAADSDGRFYWQKGDAVGVFAGGAGAPAQFTLSGSHAGRASGVFYADAPVKGMAAGDAAVYPYHGAHKYDADTKTLTYHLRPTYTYHGAIDRSHAPGAAGINSFNAPEYGVIAENGGGFSTALRHLGGVVCVTVNKLPAAEGYVTVSSQTTDLCGNFTADLSESEPTICPPAENDGDGRKAVTINFSGAEDNVGKPAAFYFPLPAAAYKDFVISVGATAGGAEATWASDPKTFTLGRAELAPANAEPVFSYTVNGNLEDGVWTVRQTGTMEDGEWKEPEPVDQTVTVTFTGADGRTYTATKASETATAYTVKGYENYSFADLGLTSNGNTLLVATTNVGASSETGNGCAFTWGNTTDNVAEARGTGGGAAATKYTAAGATLDTDDDAATQNWGGFCRTPTAEEWKTITGADAVSVSTVGTSGSQGYGVKITNKATGASVTLPAAGERNGSGYSNRYSTGHYWSSTLYTPNAKAYLMYFNGSGNVEPNATNWLYKACSVRAVIEMKNKQTVTN